MNSDKGVSRSRHRLRLLSQTVATAVFFRLSFEVWATNSALVIPSYDAMCFQSQGATLSSGAIFYHVTDTSVDNNSTKYYSIAKTDRSGQQILSMMRFHAWAHSQPHAAYGGACVDAIDFKELCKDPKKLHCKDFHSRLEDKQRLLEILGLEKELPFACPSQEDLDNGRAVLMDWKDSRYKVKKHLSRAWTKHLISKSTASFDRYSYGETIFNVAIHLRRGDYSPCRSKEKYLPNVYYEKVLDEYILPRYCSHTRDRVCNITIFTEERHFEPLDVFQNRTDLTIDVDSSLDQIWTTLLKADLTVISKSSFSYVPAILNPNLVLSPVDWQDWKYPPLEHWLLAPESIRQATQDVVDKMVEDFC